MNGVDRNNQLRKKTTACRGFEQRIWRPLWLWMLDVCLVNSFLSWKGIASAKVAAGIESTGKSCVRHSWNTQTRVFLQCIHHLRNTRPRSTSGAVLESATIVSTVRGTRRNGCPRNLPVVDVLGLISQIPHPRLAVLGAR
jgi:hypothetical protein